MSGRTAIFPALAASVLVLLGLAGCDGKPSPVARPEPKPPVAGDGFVLATKADPAEVFHRAFWRMPASDDHILHAERREWTGENKDIKSWQWYLAVRPGPALANWLMNENPFQLPLVESRGLPAVNSPPAWYEDLAKPGDWMIRMAPGKGMILMYERGGNLLLATDSGAGFASAKHPPASGKE